VRVKICGITNIQDALAAADAGADAVGLNFVAGPRKIDPARAADILSCIPLMVTPIALVKLEKGDIAQDLAELLAKYRVSCLQLYGQVNRESLARLTQKGFRPIPVIHVQDEKFADTLDDLRPADAGLELTAVVLDAYNPDIEGGTGTPLRWDWVAEARQSGRLSAWPPIILAGGLNPSNVREAVRMVKPFAVDVSSGVEHKETPGKKDVQKMRQFVGAAKSCETNDAE